jgi:V8-like Glu-specific endopeptidase
VADLKAEVAALQQALSESGCAGAAARTKALTAALDPPLDDKLTRTVLDTLRSQRCFEAMRTFAGEAAKVAQDGLLVYVQRQLAQAMIELGDLGEAVALLEDLANRVGPAAHPQDRSEVHGLMGRALKQRFVLAVAGGAKGEEELRAAVQAYCRGYAVDYDPGWHGANIVALVARAERDCFGAGTDSAAVWAQRLLAELQGRARVSWGPWDYASAGEAYLALDDDDNVADCFGQYWNMSNADGFALAGTERQLKEIWCITADSHDDLLASLVLHLEARKLTASKGGARYTPAALAKLAEGLRGATARAEATFGAGSAIPLHKVLDLLQRARSVCRIGDVHDPQRAGTGFLVNGADLNPPRDGMFVLTNHHVLHGPEADDALLESDDYRGSIDVERAKAEFYYWNGAPQLKTIKIVKILDSSPRNKLDFALASLEEAVPATVALPLSHSVKPLGSRNNRSADRRAKVIVIGYPNGGELSFSVSDNEVVDHELDDTPRDPPRRIHYRAPTEPGSSGSPVFHAETLEVVGLHRSGRVKPLRDDWPREKDEVYEANEAVSVRTLLGL